ncbi:RHS repeat-associated core domain-containing protein [Cytophagaceae bacterium ABcell3]|nr:RHS repeat-associated core domain-containing protein [Cytophagaceae bacterium ABcell3]
MSTRSYSSSSYRYGFNGMEKDDEVKGAGNSYTTFERQYDARIARWISTDPIFHEYQSAYAAFDNNPIYYRDPSGASSEGPDDDDTKEITTPAVGEDGDGNRINYKVSIPSSADTETNDEGEVTSFSYSTGNALDGTWEFHSYHWDEDANAYRTLSGITNKDHSRGTYYSLALSERKARQDNLDQLFGAGPYTPGLSTDQKILTSYFVQSRLFIAYGASFGLALAGEALPALPALSDIGVSAYSWYLRFGSLSTAAYIRGERFLTRNYGWGYRFLPDAVGKYRLQFLYNNPGARGITFGSWQGANHIFRIDYHKINNKYMLHYHWSNRAAVGDEAFKRIGRLHRTLHSIYK